MNTLLILAAIGTMAGGMGGALTNGLDGFILGGCAGFVLGVMAWVTDNLAVTPVQELHADPLLGELQRRMPKAYDQTAPHYEGHNERVHS